MDRVGLVIVGLLVYFRTEFTSSESVWLKDMTDQFQTQKRILGEADLPDELTFQVRRGAGALMLMLKRNYEIDPNTDIYVVKRTKDGRTIKSKSTPLEREAIAYYQDMENGAYMTVRCISRLNQQCERVISGHIQIGERSYDLQPAEPDATEGKVMVDMDIIGRRYLLLDQTHILQENEVANKDAKDLKELFHLYNPDEKQNNVAFADETLPSRNLAHLEETDENPQEKKNYYIKLALCMDAGIWDLYYDRVSETEEPLKSDKVKRLIRAVYLHIVNGINLRYKTIEDPSISISVIPSKFVFFTPDSEFPHKTSEVMTDETSGKKYVDAQKYLDDFNEWDKTTRNGDEDGGGDGDETKDETKDEVENKDEDEQSYDHAMLFTTYRLYKDGVVGDSGARGLSKLSGVCTPGEGTSIIMARDYVWTVQVATHELGHNLGAYHDGEGDATACKDEDNYIMSTIHPRVSKDRINIANMWIFSDCSVESFKKTLPDKDCVQSTGEIYNITEYTTFMKKPAPYIFTPDEQCILLVGKGSRYYGFESDESCYMLKCTNPATGKGLKIYVNAPEETSCGFNKWCIEGWCVDKSSE